MATDTTVDKSPSPEPTRRDRARRWLREVGPILLALLGSFLIGGVMIAISGDNPFTAYGAILRGAVGDPYNVAATVARAMPIVGAGICAALAFKAGLVNLGGEGQLVLGGLAAILVTLYVPGPGLLVLALAILAALLAGGLWALMTAWFETAFGVPILISSLLLNFVAIGFVSYMVNFPLLEPGGARSQTAMVAEGARLPRLFAGSPLSAGLFLLIAVIAAVTFVLYRMPAGYEVRMFGLNPSFARAGGVSAIRLALLTMLASGGIAGLTGAIQVLGVHYRLIDGALTGPGYAWTGVMAAILANNNPFGVVAAGLFFAAVQTGAAGMERATSVPSEISFVVQAVMILLVASRGAFQGIRRERA